MVPEYWLTEGGQSATGALLDHIIENHVASPRLANQAASHSIKPSHFFFTFSFHFYWENIGWMLLGMWVWVIRFLVSSVSIINVHCKAWKNMMRFLNEVEQSNCKPSPHVFCSLINGLGRLQVLKEFRGSPWISRLQCTSRSFLLVIEDGRRIQGPGRDEIRRDWAKC